MRPAAPDPLAGLRAERDALVARLFVGALRVNLAASGLGCAFVILRGGERLGGGLALGAGLVGLAGAALLAREFLVVELRRRPALLLLAPIPACVAIVVDGGSDSVFQIVAFAAVGLPATLGWPSLSLGAAAFVSAVLVAGALGDGAAAASAVSSSAATVAGALAISLPLYVLARFVGDVPGLLVELRESSPALAPGRPAALPRAPQRTAGLTAAERRAVASLARLGAPKLVAVDLGVGLATVRSHLKASKRKTGARTLDELVGVATEERVE